MKKLFKILRDFFKGFFKNIQKYFKNIFPKIVTKAIRKQGGLARVIPFAPNYNRTLTSHLHDACFKNRLTHRLFSPSQWIENVICITMTNHTKIKCFHTIIEVSNLVLSDYGRTVFHHI